MRQTSLFALCSLIVAGCLHPPEGEPPSSPPTPDAGVLPVPDAGGQPGCADPSELYPDVFQAEIMPVLTGEVDLDPDPSMSNVGCTRFECHGRVRGPESLFLDPNDTAENNLGRFMCFVDLADPAASQALLCPLGDPGCFSFPHPGADIFLGEDDRNYQHILAYLLLIAPAPADAEGDL